MASLSRALRVAATCPRRGRTRGLGLRALTGQAGPTAEKSVPYRRTLKEPQGPSTVARGPSQPLPSTAHVVVIGGGSLGCQTLYHLAKLGVSGAVLLERERLTSGTTWHTAGRGRGRGCWKGLIPGWQPEAAALEEEGHGRRGFTGRWGVLLAPHVSDEQRWGGGSGAVTGAGGPDSCLFRERTPLPRQSHRG